MSKSIYSGAILTTTLFSFENKVRVNHQGAVYTAEGELIFNSLRKSSYAGVKHIADSYIYPKELQRKKVIKGDCYYIGHFHEHFGHFLVETLPELIIGLSTGKQIVAHRFTTQSNAFETAFASQVLETLGLNKEDIILVEDVPVICDSLEVRPRVTVINKSISNDAKAAYQYFTSLVPNSSKDVQKVYLSRSAYNKRGSPKSVDVSMKKQGYIVYHPQEHSFIDQVTMMKGVSEIAGFDGSALHLSAFMKPGGTVTVLNKRRNPNTLMINQLMNHKTRYPD
jgi:capsular polysaccharide biosynthesis protein